MLNYILLGIIQGITEFLPISSSGHVIIFKRWFDIEGKDLALNIVLHLGTLLSIIVFFWKDIKVSIRDFSLCKNIIVTTTVTAVIAVLCKGIFENLFTIPKVSSLGLGITSVILLSTSRYMHGKKVRLSTVDAVLVGLFQAVAIVPGISRSGATISIQLWRDIERKSAFRYSFFIAVPAILGAVVLETPHLGQVSITNPSTICAGFLSAFLAGLISLKILLAIIQKMKISFFGYYCLVVSLVSLVI